MSRDVFVVAEHRQGELRDISFELLTKGRVLAKQSGGTLCSIVLGDKLDDIVEALKSHAERILYIEDPRLHQFHSDYYQHVLASFISDRKPLLTILGHTAYGWEVAPSLATELDLPLAAGCVDVAFEDAAVVVSRQVYGGKILGDYVLGSSWGYVATCVPGAFAASEGGLDAELERVESPLTEDIAYKKFLRFVEVAAGEVDIAQAQKIVAVGRGIKEQENLRLVENFAASIGAAVACSRPVVDSGWLPKDRQVGSSGKTVKPKLYIALGISGDFQHIMGMKGADTIIAVNKDANAPIFAVADYGVVDDLFKVIPALNNKIVEMQS